MGRQTGILRRTDATGLGYQSRNLCRMLNPEKTLDIAHGEDIPSFAQFEDFLKDIDVMLTAETPYTYSAWEWAKLLGVKTICQPNWEFFDGLVQPNMPHPDQYIMPSYWHLEDMQKLFPDTIYLPPPTFEDDFAEVRKINFKRTGKRRFVHIIGNGAMYDRNGWSAIIDTLPQTKSDFELVVFSQREMTGYADPRVKYFVSEVEDQADLFRDFDALIMPRRYGGLCLPMNEALMSGLPVIMTDIEPNNKVLPNKWLCESQITAQFEGRSVIDVYSPLNLAEKIDWFCSLDDKAMLAQKQEAFDIGVHNYSEKVLLPKYKELIVNLTGIIRK